MRIAGTIPHPLFHITGYSMERWWWLEIEGGPMRQTYRFQKERFPTWESVEHTVTAEWLAQVKLTFDAMYGNWSAHLSRVQGE
jgi:hypothetical protein